MLWPLTILSVAVLYVDTVQATASWSDNVKGQSIDGEGTGEDGTEVMRHPPAIATAHGGGGTDRGHRDRRRKEHAGHVQVAPWNSGLQLVIEHPTMLTVSPRVTRRAKWRKVLVELLPAVAFAGLLAYLALRRQPLINVSSIARGLAPDSAARERGEPWWRRRSPFVPLPVEEEPFYDIDTGVHTDTEDE
ncbi:conserved hypothetical protein [Neospora caninum Liverpool]|uniref:Transmembrane protein n=1 Tax=Neospora caninum (strain Liverpool) TaxID=572307 RepID=F0VKQ0_NEOCL|nr:conserved hypothetical protein [Neospora caninum Liverpool]CBZ54651.1 conserved hypothetical protein [Neospora caninum Liverpool]CEL69368.1 TPA: hypothetical protein BN1204_050790 [Neospora caninum Liverpool]|eukprot:XP_003884681.1 conserved hypothetical protein [Neospora caninum Liverpool]